MKQQIKDRIEQINQGIIPEGYKKTEVGIIPKDWEVKRLDDVFEVYGGESIPRNRLGDKGYPYLHYGDIHKLKKYSINIQEDIDECFKLNKKLGEVKTGCLLDNGDVVFADASEDYQGIGKHVVVKNTSNIPFIAGLHTMIAKSKTNQLNNLFKEFIFQNYNVRKQFMYYATGISVLGITLDNIKKIKLPIPIHVEQQKIADVLSTWDRAIELKESLIKDKRIQKKGLMQKLFTTSKNKVFKKTKIGDVLIESKEIEKDPQVNKLITVRLHLAGVEKRKLRGNETVGSTTLYKRRKGQFIYGKQNFHNGSLGLMPEELDGYASSSDIPSFDFKESIVDSIYFYNYWSQSNSYSKLINYTTGTGSKRLNPNDFFNIKMPLPPLPDQQRIAKILFIADKEIELLQDEVTILKEQKKGLMQLLLTGIIRVGEDNHA